MNKTELVAAIAERTELTKKDAEKALKAFVDVVTEQLKAGDKEQLVTESTQEQKRLSTSQLLKLLSSKL